MKKNSTLIILIAVLAILFYAGAKFAKKNNSPVANNSAKTQTKIRIGWQTPWATQGQLTEVLKNTNLLKDNGLNGEFAGFAYGAPLNEAALAGNVDVIFTADQPAATLLAKDPNWVIIGRLMYNRVSLYVPMNSPIRTLAQLKGKTIGMPYGAAAQRMALRIETKLRLNPLTDVKNINLAMDAQGDLIKKNPESAKWGEVDAMAGFDPAPATFEENGWTRTLYEESVTSVIVMSKKYITANPKAPVEFLKAFNSAYDYYRLNTAQADEWFIKDSNLSITRSALAKAASVEPNLKAEDKSKISISLNDGDYKILQDAADFIYSQGLIKTQVTMKDHIDLSYLNAALK